MKEVIRVNRLSYAFPGQSNLALQDINFTITQGDFVGIIGPNGSGKTTLIKNIIGVLTPTSGSIELFGVPREKFRSWGKIGYVPQHLAGFDTNFPANVFEIVKMGLVAKVGLFHRSGHSHDPLVWKALETVSMKDFAHRRISQLSGGQQQRVLIARALVAEPELLFLDEPTAEVDAQSQRGFYDLLKTLNKDFGITIILVAHDIGLVTKLARTIICVNRELLCYGTPAKTLAKIEQIFTHSKLIHHDHHHD